MCVTLCLYRLTLTGAARAGLRCNNGKPTFKKKKKKKKKTALVSKMLLLVLVLLFYDVIIN